MARDDPQMKIRFPRDLKARIEQEAKKNNRSMNSEVIARLEATIEGFGEYSFIGVDAVTRRLEALLLTSEDIAFKLMYELRLAGGAVGEEDKIISEVITEISRKNDVTKQAAVRAILYDWLVQNDYITEDVKKPRPPRAGGAVRRVSADKAGDKEA